MPTASLYTPYCFSLLTYFTEYSPVNNFHYASHDDLKKHLHAYYMLITLLNALNLTTPQRYISKIVSDFSHNP